MCLSCHFVVHTWRYLFRGMSDWLCHNLIVSFIETQRRSFLFALKKPPTLWMALINGDLFPNFICVKIDTVTIITFLNDAKSSCVIYSVLHSWADAISLFFLFLKQRGPRLTIIFNSNGINFHSTYIRRMHKTLHYHRCFVVFMFCGLPTLVCAKDIF